MLSFFLCIFKREYWIKNINVIDETEINDFSKYSNFDNTAPHSKFGPKVLKIKMHIFARTFNN